MDIKVQVGERIIYDELEYSIHHIINMTEIICQSLDESKYEIIKIENIKKSKDLPPLQAIHPIEDDKEWDIAYERFQLIKPILKPNITKAERNRLIAESPASRSKIFRLLKLYRESGCISGLRRKGNHGAPGVKRLDSRLNKLIDEVINDKFLSPRKHKASNIILEIQLRCKDLSLTPPSDSTVRNRISEISSEIKLGARFGAHAAKMRHSGKEKSFKDLKTPLQVVQIDHSPVDIICVDDDDRNPLGRPNMTVAMDVYSRMIVGLYVSFETPGAIGTGLCLSSAILPKEKMLAEYGIKGEWPCWGIMDVVHVDNAQEFRGTMLSKAAKEYDIELDFRPAGAPEFGGHIERVIGTVEGRVHDLPGTTFNTVTKRVNYNSEKQSAFTLKELEKWLVTYIVNIYHHSIHQSLGRAPIHVYKEGLLPVNGAGRGIPPRIANERKVYLDFLPFEERTIQNYGVKIKHIIYYSDVIRRWINSMDGRYKKKFICRYDPRDISKIYFLDPELEEYFEIPYRDTSLPSISTWEHQKAMAFLKKKGIKEIRQDIIFGALRELKEIEDNALSNTRKKRRAKPVKSNQVVPNKTKGYDSSIFDDEITHYGDDD